MSVDIKENVAALKRRALYLRDHKLNGPPDYNGRLYDLNEFRALEWALLEVGYPLEAPRPQEDREDREDRDQPPRRDEIPAQRGSREWRPGGKVPSEPRRARYVPGGGM